MLLKPKQNEFSFSKKARRQVRRQARKGTKLSIIERGLGFGGEIRYRKGRRPFSPKLCTHIILRSSLLAGARSLLRSNHRMWTENLLAEKVLKYQARLYSFSINSNHLHLLIKFANANLQAQFLKDFAGTLALKIKRAFRISKDQRVWDDRPFSRLIKPGSFPAIRRYIEKNDQEATGLKAYTPRPLSELVKALTKWAEKKARRCHQTDGPSPTTG
jgi:REP element-mobilizing transposase RayT